MIQSLLFLYKHPYNKRYPFFALKRFLEWKIIRLFKFENYKITIWNNRKIYLNYDSFQSMWIMYNWLVDWEEFNLIKDFVRVDSCSIDVGANMGFYTIWLSKFTNNILSFEPNPKNFCRLNQNISANNANDQIRAYNIAVGQVNGNVRFTTNLDGENHISIHNSEEKSTVVCKRL